MEDEDRRSVLLGLAACMGAPPYAASASMRTRLPDVIAEYEAASGGRIGIHAKNLASGKLLEWRSDERFVMCSVFKASLAGCVLARVDRGSMQLNDHIEYGPADIQDWYAPVARANVTVGRLSVRELCQGSVEQSDNTCANILLEKIGGPPALTRFWRSLGDSTSRLDDPEPFLNRTPMGGLRNTTTPRAMARTLRTLTMGGALTSPSRRLLLTWLEGCKTGAHRLRGGLPATWVIGNKTGNNGEDAFGDVGMAWPRPGMPIVISVFTRGGSPREVQVEKVFSSIGAYVARYLA